MSEVLKVEVSRLGTHIFCSGDMDLVTLLFRSHTDCSRLEHYSFQLLELLLFGSPDVVSPF